MFNIQCSLQNHDFFIKTNIDELNKYLKVYSSIDIFTNKAQIDYKKILKYHKDGNSIFSDKFLELVFIACGSWGIKRSKVGITTEREKFFDSLKNDTIKQKLIYLKNYELSDFIIEEKALLICESIKYIFDNLSIFKSDDRKTKIVPISKLLHFYFPKLVSPIDNAYTKKFFNFDNENQDCFEIFIQIHMIFAKSICNIKQIISINSIIPKVFDNIIIGYIKYNSLTSVVDLTLSNEIAKVFYEICIYKNITPETLLNKLTSTYLSQDEELKNYIYEVVLK